MVKVPQIKKLDGYSQQCTQGRRYVFNIDGEILYFPSMTTVLKGTEEPLVNWRTGKTYLEEWKEEQKAKGIPLDKASNRGTKVHELFETFLLTGDEPNPDDLENDIKGFYTALKPQFEIYDHTIAIECAVYDPRTRIAGRLDQLFFHDNKIIISDIKTKIKKVIHTYDGQTLYRFNKPKKNRRISQDLVCERVDKLDSGEYKVVTRKSKSTTSYEDKPSFIESYELQMTGYMGALIYHNPHFMNYDIEGHLLFASQNGDFYKHVLSFEEMRDTHWPKLLDRAKQYHEKHQAVKLWEKADDH